MRCCRDVGRSGQVVPGGSEVLFQCWPVGLIRSFGDDFGVLDLQTVMEVQTFRNIVPVTRFFLDSRVLAYFLRLASPTLVQRANSTCHHGVFDTVVGFLVGVDKI